HNNEVIANLSREFLNSNGAEKHININVNKQENYEKEVVNNFTKAYEDLANDLNICSKKGLVEKFDSTIGAGTILMPFGGKYQETPIQAMVNKIPVEKGETKTCSVMAWGYNPFISEKNQFAGAYFAVIESVCKLIATGAKFEDVYLTFQEYFERLGKDENKWGKPLASLLGAFLAQKELGICAIGGKDSMSGTFENINVPPTLVSFAVTTENVDNIISPEFKKAESKVVLLKPKYEGDFINIQSLKENFDLISELIRKGEIISAYTPTYGGIAEGIMKMCFGNKIGFNFNENIDLNDIFKYNYGSFILELKNDLNIGLELGKTTNENSINYKNEKIDLNNIFNIYSEKLEPVYKTKVKAKDDIKVEAFSYTETNYKKPSFITKTPKVLIPVFFGTNCEYDSAKAFENAGAKAEIFVINNLSSYDICKSIEKFSQALKESQILFLAGGFSGGDEPDGSAKFITSFFRNNQIKEEVNNLLENRDGLISGICNGFQALIKLGLVPYGKIVDINENMPTLTYNTIKRHQSKLVQTRIASNKSPWLSNTNVGEIYTVPISHGEGRFICDENMIKELAKNGQIATQYVDFNNNPTMDIEFNPNGSMFAIEGITSPDGRVFGKMGHSERIGYGLYKNYDSTYDMKMFKSAIDYFK
ncbi:MAG: phosphoribosylformylglycinamidine synthase subunit PurQ, partial [Eubacteriales bacterium]|nr:phosphoribosylformylglycinamidine synthase subunit PurQ [Eubacteriales bacterium]